MQKKGATAENTEQLIEKMFKAGVHYGYSKTRRHPSLAKYIYATKNKSDIIDLEKTISLLNEAGEFMKGLGSLGKTILFVGTKPEAKKATKDAASSLNMPYVTERWIGGTLSNFTEIRKRVNELENYHKESAAGELNKYTKKEQLMLSKKMEKLSRYYSGLISLKKSPDAIVIIDAKSEHIAATEAKKHDVPIISLVNSDSNIKNIDYPVVGNDSAIPSIKFFTQAICEAYQKGSSEKASQTPPPTKEN